MLDVILWYVVLQTIGLAALPVAFRLFGRLPDRGYAFARPLGLLLAAYLLWLGASFGLLDNRPTTIGLVVGALGVAAWGLLRREAADVGEVWRRRGKLILITEGLFLAAYLGWCSVRAYMPEVASTEKPMEFAFFNAILRSEHFPPADPWLSGYSISYYYFGYLMAALLTELSGIAPGVAFNLVIATLFALTATGAFSLGYNLVEGVTSPHPPSPLAERGDAALISGPSPATRERGAEGGVRAPYLAGALAALFVLVLANWEGVLEVLHAHGFGSPDFWRWVGIKDLSHPFLSPVWYPTDQQDNWWWFRAARVIADYGADGKARDYTINEFPFFSFLLGDMHPHVLALPFAFLAMSLALNLLRSPAGDWSWLHRPPGAPAWLAWALRTRVLGFALSWLVLYPVEALRRRPGGALAVGIVFGGLSFLNAWDMPTYVFVLTGAFALQRFLARPRFDAVLRREVLGFGWLVLLAGIVLYVPFYVGFRSQASVPWPVGYRSHLHHFLIFWGPLLFVVGSFLVAQLRRAMVPGRPELTLAPPGDRARAGGVWPGVAVVMALVLVLQFPPVAARVPFWAQAPALAVILPLLVASATLVWRYLAGSTVWRPGAEDAASAPAGRKGGSGPAEVAGGAVPASLAPEHVFVLFLAFTALLLIFGTEFVFIRDLFGNRMNTVFKLYYQAWAMLAIVAAYGVYYLASAWPRAGAPAAVRLGARAWLVLGVVAVAGGLVYPPAALLSRAGASAGPATLDGTAYLAWADPSDYAAIQWLQRNVSGNPVIVEASGGSYSQFGRISENTGLPTLLGWDFHEMQWRGSYDEQRRRQADLDTIYRSTDNATVLSLLRQYGVTYVYVGPLEVEKYGRPDRAGLDKFAGFMDTAYQQDGVVIYRMRGER